MLLDSILVSKQGLQMLRHLSEIVLEMVGSLRIHQAKLLCFGWEMQMLRL